MIHPFVRCLVPALVFVVAACGKPKERSGMEAEFVTASMGGAPATAGPDRPLAADLAVEPVSMLVMFNRLKTPEMLQEALNKKAGQFSHLDLDKDNSPDPLTVAARDTTQGHAFEIRVRPTTGEYVVATMVFDPEWSYLGHYNGALGGAASTAGRPLPATPAASAVVSPASSAPAPASTPAAPPVAAIAAGPGAPAQPPPSATPPVQAVPAGTP